MSVIFVKSDIEVHWGQWEDGWNEFGWDKKLIPD